LGDYGEGIRRALQLEFRHHMNETESNRSISKLIEEFGKAHPNAAEVDGSIQ
jgi:ABC-type glycerol-3-phosphate transport system substrate-binding protein